MFSCQIFKQSILLALFLSSQFQNTIATAVGYEYWSIKHVPRLDIDIPGGQLTGVIEGRGTHVTQGGGSFLSLGNVCNWYVYLSVFLPATYAAAT